MPLWQSIGIDQVSANFRIKYIGIRSVSKKWYWCITNTHTYIHSYTHTYTYIRMHVTYVRTRYKFFHSKISSALRLLTGHFVETQFVQQIHVMIRVNHNEKQLLSVATYIIIIMYNFVHHSSQMAFSYI